MPSPTGSASFRAQASDAATAMNEYMRDLRMLLFGGLFGALLAWFSSRSSKGKHVQLADRSPAKEAGSRFIRRSIVDDGSTYDRINTLLGSCESKVVKQASTPPLLESEESDSELDKDFCSMPSAARRSLTVNTNPIRNKDFSGLPSAAKRSQSDKLHMKFAGTSSAGLSEFSRSNADARKALDSWRRRSMAARVATEHISADEDPVSRVNDLCFALRSGDRQPTLNSTQLDLIEKAMRLSRDRHRKEVQLQQLQRRLSMNFGSHKEEQFFLTTWHARDDNEGSDDTDDETDRRESLASSNYQVSQGTKVLTKLRRRLNVILPLRRGMLEHRKEIGARQREAEIARIQAELPKIGDACQLPSSIRDAVATSASSLHLWNFDIFKLASLVPKPMPLISHLALRGTGLADLLGGSLSEIQQVFTLWSDMYNENLPFHTSLHAADVTQAIYHALTSVGLLGRIPSLRSLTMVLSAAAHDIGHPGVNNAFLVACGDELALRYNDKSVLENMHCATAFLLVHESRIDFWGRLGKEGAQLVRKDMIANILATDMAEHTNCVASVQKIGETLPDWSDVVTQTTVCKSVVHAADISNPARPWDTYWSWAERVMEEFFRQSDLEKQHGLKFPGGLSFLSRRTPMNVPQFQLGFVKAVILPFNLSLGKIKDLDYSDYVDQLNLNIEQLARESAVRQEELKQLDNNKD